MKTNTTMSMKNVVDLLWIFGAPLGLIALAFTFGARLA
jgi:hypothetical protein